MAKNRDEARGRRQLPSVNELLKRTYLSCRQHWQILLSVLGVYAAVDLFFGSGLTNISNSVSNLNASNAATHSSRLSTALDGLSHVVGTSSSNSGGSSSALPSLLIIIELLVMIWVVRQLASERNFSVKDAYYKSMGQLIQFLLVVVVLILELIPAAIGSAILVSVFAGTPNALAGLAFIIIFLGLSAWSLRMLSGSIFALFLVTESGAEPVKSLRMAGKLAAGRRLEIVLRLLPLPILIVAAMFVILLLLTLTVSGLAPLAFYVLGLLVLPISTLYVYDLFRSLNHGD